MSLIDSVSGVMSGQGAGDLVNNITSGFMMWTKIILIIAGISLLVIFIWKFWVQYKIKITLYKRVGLNSTDVIEEKAKMVTDEQGKTKIQLYKTKSGKRRATCPLPAAMFKSKIGSRDHYHLWMDDDFVLHPILPPNNDVPGLNIIPQERSAWERLEKEEMTKRFNISNNLMKYAPLIGLAIVCIISFLIFFFFFKTIGGGMSELSQQFGQMATNCMTMKGGG